MFFTRLAIAALSFGSIAQVFAAPIATGLEGNTVALTVPVAEQAMVSILALVIPKVEGIKARVSDLAADPVGFTVDKANIVIAGLVPALHLVSLKLDSLVNKDAILLIGDGAVKTTPAAIASDMANLIRPVHDIVTFALGLESVDALKSTCEQIKTEVAHIKTGIESTSVASADPPLLGLIGIVLDDLVVLVGP
ncbi:hypothetical protein BDV93DRAFT_523288 [Ceratobasidium sp. AG-I]|nr:hypothetical protein BDV93DRAFT_523288 [Ceratobasidium sp. AG-I]